MLQLALGYVTIVFGTITLVAGIQWMRSKFAKCPHCGARGFHTEEENFFDNECKNTATFITRTICNGPGKHVLEERCESSGA